MSSYYEGFKGRASTSSGNSGMSAAAAGVGLASMSNSGGGTMERCPLNDNSIYCTLARTTNILGMIMYIIFMIILFGSFSYFAYNYLMSSNKKGKK